MGLLNGYIVLSEQFLYVGDQSHSTIDLVYPIIQIDYLTIKYFYHQYWSSHIPLNGEINTDIQIYFYADMSKIDMQNSSRQIHFFHQIIQYIYFEQMNTIWTVESIQTHYRVITWSVKVLVFKLCIDITYSSLSMISIWVLCWALKQLLQ